MVAAGSVIRAEATHMVVLVPVLQLVLQQLARLAVGEPPQGVCHGCAHRTGPQMEMPQPCDLRLLYTGASPAITVPGC